MASAAQVSGGGEHSALQLGIAPVPDWVRALGFSHTPRMTIVPHAALNLAVARVAGFEGEGRVTVTSRADGFDSFSVSPGGTHVVEGHYDGRPFRKRGGDVRVTWAPSHVQGSATFPVSLPSLHLILPPGFMAGRLDAALLRPLDPIIYERSPPLARMIRLVETEILRPGFASDLFIDGMTRAIAMQLARLDPGAIAESTGRIHLSGPRLRRVLEHIEAHLAEPINIDVLAGLACLSPFHFSRVFKRTTGFAPYNYLVNRRVELARELLADADLEISEIARRCGFADQAHFTRAFGKLMGMPPGRFRRARHL